MQDNNGNMPNMPEPAGQPAARAPRMPAKGPAAAVPRQQFVPAAEKTAPNAGALAGQTYTPAPPATPATQPLRLALPPEDGRAPSLDDALPLTQTPCPAKPQNPVLNATQGFKRVTAQMPAAKPVWQEAEANPKMAGRVPGAAYPAAGIKPGKKQVYKKTAGADATANGQASAFAAQRARAEALRRKRKKIKRVVTVCAIVLVALALAVTILTQFVFVFVRVQDSGMQNTINNRDTVAALRTAYINSTPLREDIVVFKNPDTGQKNLGRVIGLPGDTINIDGGKVTVQPPASGNSADGFSGQIYGAYEVGHTFAAENGGSFTVPADHYFILGDNRNVATDSRHWANSYVPTDNILGRLAARLFPEWTVF